MRSAHHVRGGTKDHDREEVGVFHRHWARRGIVIAIAVGTDLSPLIAGAISAIILFAVAMLLHIFGGELGMND